MHLSRQVLAIVRKDLLSELRGREVLASMFVFSLISLFVFSFSFELRVENVAEVVPGVLWVAFAFTGVLGLGRSFIREKDQGCLDGLLLCPIDRSVIYMGKALVNFAFISIVELVILPLAFGLFNLRFPVALLPIVFLGTVGFASVGTLFSAISVHGRGREALLPVLIFPIVIPALIAAVRLTGGLIDGQPWPEMSHWLSFLVAFDVIFTTIAFLLFDAVMTE